MPLPQKRSYCDVQEDEPEQTEASLRLVLVGSRSCNGSCPFRDELALAVLSDAARRGLSAERSGRKTRPPLIRSLRVTLLYVVYVLYVERGFSS
jgi:hypothetical protein